MLKSVRGIDEQVKKQSLGKTDATCPTIRMMGGHVCKPSVVAQAVNIVSVRLGGEGWRRSRDKNKYSDRYRMSGVKWCRVVGVACPATIRLSASTAVQNGMARVAWAGHPEKDLLVVGEVLHKPVNWSPMVIYSRISTKW
ncbi:hypothetical protein TIFTF001_055740 [Ficus carica]|uniref:Uncharacterized protein n=1 Tax=Ficus carica TaxID=3494 RepID=A0AA88JGL0_FICCA|nr:hypothetical protein TIFTF001_055737 [Ficus carica]GMN73744.1 hypothetical protein TIFTF001_055738 [Ficus carica]GMN73750.1 hypothetical protein TIFTF001_055739 [Ficus carica]GMN73756.1 hypothetical protein TIFTF001_055740 [Ficus carica]